MTVCMENTFHPQNASALVRNCEAFGIQDIHTVEALCKFSPNVNIVRGTDKWVDIHKTGSTGDLIAALRAKGYRIVATSPHTDDRTPENFDVTAGRFALFFGTEHAGISDEVMRCARRIHPHPDVRIRRKPQRLGIGGDPAVHAVDAAPGVVRRLADSGRRAGRNPAALDENDRPGRRTDHETGRFLSSLKTNKARLRERFPRPYFLLFPDIMLRELRSTRHAPSPSHEFRNGPFR